MTALDRLFAASSTSREKPVIVWSGSPGHEADGVVVGLNQVEEALATHGEQAVLAEIMSPFGRALRRQSNLSDLLSDDPSRGKDILSGFAEETRSDIARAYTAGAHGIFYRLDGAYPAASTPMEYGGHYLELDRELLSAATARSHKFVLLYIEGESEIYLDFVLDLPCNAIGWDVAHHAAELESVKGSQQKVIAAAHPLAEIFLAKSIEEARQLANVTHSKR